MTKKSQKAVGSKTLAIKAQGFNKVKNYFNPKHELFNTPGEQKLEAIQKVMDETYLELRNYKDKRKSKAKVQELRDQKKKEEFIATHPEFASIMLTSFGNGHFKDFAKLVNKMETEKV